MGHRILRIGYATETKYYGAHGLKVLYSTYDASSEGTVINVAFLYRDVDGAIFKQIDAFTEEEGEENKFATKMVDFTAQGSNLVYKNAKGWNVFLLATYNQYYVAAKKQAYESFGEFDEAEDSTEEGGFYNLGIQAFTKFTPSITAASTQTCQKFYGQADTLQYAFQAQSCSSCSFIYETARSFEEILDKDEVFDMQYDLYAAM